MKTQILITAVLFGLFGAAACRPVVVCCGGGEWASKKDMDDVKKWIGWGTAPVPNVDIPPRLNVKQFQDSVQIAICALELKVNELVAESEHVNDVAPLDEPDLLCDEDPEQDHNQPPPVPPFF